jgi:hypothetical protein
MLQHAAQVQLPRMPHYRLLPLLLLALAAVLLHQPALPAEAASLLCLAVCLCA